MATPPPPFRADMVGSLLRRQAVHDARTAHADGRLDDAGLAQVEDEAILSVIRSEEEAGLHAVTDGEFCRGWWHFDFFDLLDGVDVVEGQSGMAFQGPAPALLAPLGPDEPLATAGPGRSLWRARRGYQLPPFPIPIFSPRDAAATPRTTTLAR